MTRPRPISRALRLSVLLALAVACGLTTLPATADAGGIAQEVRTRLLHRINADRARHGLAPVALDAHASQVADGYCGAQIEAGTRGHYSVDGLPPYMRYSFAGVEGTVLENVASWSATRVIPPEAVPDLAEKSHNEMISEVPPNDGHRRAILDPHATHVGIGASWGGGEVRVAEVLLRRYVDWTSADRTVTPGTKRTYRARILPSVAQVERVTVHYEPFPYRLSRERANLIDTYRMPPEWMAFEPERRRSPLDVAIRKESVENPPQFRISGGEVELEVPFTRGRGVYTIVIWARAGRSSDLFAATNLSIIADDASSGHAAGRH